MSATAALPTPTSCSRLTVARLPAAVKRLARRVGTLVIAVLEGMVVDRQHIVAVALLTEPEVRMLGLGFDRLWPIDDAPHFLELLQAIDEADRELAQSTP